MSSERQNKTSPDAPESGMTAEQPVIYQIRVKSHLDSAWAEWFEGLAIVPAENGETLLTGLVVDQAALHGLLKKMRDLGISLISINPVEKNESHAENTHQENLV